MTPCLTPRVTLSHRSNKETGQFNLVQDKEHQKEIIHRQRRQHIQQQTIAEVWMNHELEETVPSIEKEPRAQGQPGAKFVDLFWSTKGQKRRRRFRLRRILEKEANAHGSNLLQRVYICIPFSSGTQTHLV